MRTDVLLTALAWLLMTGTAAAQSGGAPLASAGPAFWQQPKLKLPPGSQGGLWINSPPTVTEQGGVSDFQNASGDWLPPPEDPGEEPEGNATTRRPGALSGGFLGKALGNLPTLPAKREDSEFEPREILIASGDVETAKAVAEAMRQAGFSLRRRKVLRALGFVLSTFRGPAKVDVPAVVKQLRAQSPDVWLDANHRYRPQGGAARYARRLIGWRTTPGCGRGFVLGLVDGPVDARHPALAGRAIRVKSLLGRREQAAAPAHATAIAGLLLGAPGTGFEGLLPEAELHLAVVLRKRGEVSDATAERLVVAIDHLLGQGVPLTMLSLAGPPNKLLELALIMARRQRMQFVAAAGNTGKEELRYPAAYEGVLGVTAVDAREFLYRRATRGAHVDIAAPGVDLRAPAPGGGARYVSGTSFAVPFAAAALLLERAYRPAPEQASAALLQRVRDLGPPGPDPSFGHGLLQSPGCGAREN